MCGCLQIIKCYSNSVEVSSPQFFTKNRVFSLDINVVCIPSIKVLV